jgi:two-component system sensor histidine kinase VanS
VVLTVENTGEHLTRQLVATLAEPFQRGSKRIHTHHGGVGLGLAIVKSVAQAHDGTLTPRAAGGLCVAVELPAAPPLLADDRLGNSSTLRAQSTRRVDQRVQGVRATPTSVADDSIVRPGAGSRRRHALHGRSPRADAGCLDRL